MTTRTQVLTLLEATSALWAADRAPELLELAARHARRRGRRGRRPRAPRRHPRPGPGRDPRRADGRRRAARGGARGARRGERASVTAGDWHALGAPVRRSGALRRRPPRPAVRRRRAAPLRLPRDPGGRRARAARAAGAPPRPRAAPACDLRLTGAPRALAAGAPARLASHRRRTGQLPVSPRCGHPARSDAHRLGRPTGTDHVRAAVRLVPGAGGRDGLVLSRRCG